jgi:general secretion pathway protein D
MLSTRVVRITLLLGIVLTMNILSVSAAPILSIEPPSQGVRPGQSFSLDVHITGVTDLYAFQFDLAFNPAVLSAGSITEGAFLPSGGVTSFIPGTIDNTAGSITFTADTLIGAIPGVSGSGIFATIDFQALALGTSAITLSNVILLDSNLAEITVNTVDGNVSVSAVPEPSPTLLLALGLAGVLGYRWRQRVQAV